MPNINEINLSCLSEPVTPGSDTCTIFANPTVSVSGTLALPRLKNLGGNASTDNSSSINTTSPSFEFIGKIQEIGDGSFTLPSILKHNGVTYLKDTDNNRKLNIFFQKVRKWDNPVIVGGDPMPVPLPDPELYPNLEKLKSTVYAASQGIGKIVVNFSESIECITCLEKPPLDEPIEIPCPNSCPQSSLIMTDDNGTFVKN